MPPVYSALHYYTAIFKKTKQQQNTTTTHMVWYEALATPIPD